LGRSSRLFSKQVLICAVPVGSGVRFFSFCVVIDVCGVVTRPLGKHDDSWSPETNNSASVALLQLLLLKF